MQLAPTHPALLNRPTGFPNIASLAVTVDTSDDPGAVAVLLLNAEQQVEMAYELDPSAGLTRDDAGELTIAEQAVDLLLAEAGYRRTTSFLLLTASATATIVRRGQGNEKEGGRASTKPW